MRFPLVAATTDTFSGATGHASPNSVDSDRVASGMRSPILIMGRLLLRWVLCCGPSVLDANDLLAEVLTAQDSDERLRRLRETLRDVFTSICSLAGSGIGAPASRRKFSAVGSPVGREARTMRRFMSAKGGTVGLR